MAGNIFSTESSSKAGRNAPSFPSRCLAKMPQRRSGVDLHGFSLHNPLASLLGLPISFSCESVFCDVASCQWGTGLRSPDYFACQPRSKAVLFSICFWIGSAAVWKPVHQDRCTDLQHGPTEMCFVLLQTSLLKIVLLSNCTCSLQRGKGRDPEHVWSLRNCHLSCSTKNQFN